MIHDPPNLYFFLVDTDHPARGLEVDLVAAMSGLDGEDQEGEALADEAVAELKKEAPHVLRWLQEHVYMPINAQGFQRPSVSWDQSVGLCLIESPSPQVRAVLCDRARRFTITSKDWKNHMVLGFRVVRIHREEIVEWTSDPDEG